jgi:LPXTG-motif cell wall-anchored protein
MSRCRALVVLLAVVLALPSSALAQGAGDEQYQDPFGEEQAQNDGGSGGGGGGANAAQDDGLSDEPPVGGDDPAPAPEPAPEDPAPEEEAAPADEPALPNTGSDPRVIAFLGLLFVLVGVGLRLRTLDPDAY